MRRRDFLRATAWAAASSAVAGCKSGLQPLKPAAEFAVRRPNIIFVMVDDMGWADLGCYGSRQIHTPHIDKMAAEGIRFTHSYSGCTVCAPARSVLMTGLHMGHTPVRGNTGGVPLPDDAVTVAEALHKAGYATGGFGKWGLGDVRTEGVPERQGFDEFFGYYHQIHAHDYWTDYLWHNSEKVPMTGDPGTPQRYSHYRIFDRTMDFIRRNKDRPFFCYAPWTPPHGAYQIPESDPAWHMYRDKPWPRQAKVVAAMDTMVDRQVGALLGLLKELAIDEKTIVFFCSDNGAAERFDGVLDSSGPLRGAKRSMYEGGIRVPLIARWPGRIQPGRVSDYPCYFADMMPTLAELADASGHAADRIDGISLVPTLLGGPDLPKTRGFMYWEWHLYDWGQHRPVPNGLMQAVRMGNWKAVRHRSSEPFELYDLDADVSESNNVAGQHSEIIRKVEAYIAQNRTEPNRQIEPTMPPGRQYR